jgi:hypothetical protein
LNDPIRDVLAQVLDPTLAQLSAAPAKLAAHLIALRDQYDAVVAERDELAARLADRDGAAPDSP